MSVKDLSIACQLLRPEPFARYDFSGIVCAMKIEHVEHEQRFLVRVNDTEAELTYQAVSPGLVDYNHTWVPPELRGGGIAGRLVKHALDHARREGWNVRPGCSFVEAFISRHPEYQDVTVREDSR